MIVKIVLVVCSLLVIVEGGKCPCATQDLCDPITNTTRREVFIFSLNNDRNSWEKYDFTKVTTVVMVGYDSPELMCHAHKFGVRAVTIANYPVEKLTNAAARTVWVNKMLAIVKENFLDGVNIDFEDPISKNEVNLERGYTSLVAEANQRFKQELPYSQITVDVAWRQPCIDDRCYDYSGLSAVSDFVFVMAYDERSQILGECIAGANSPLVNAQLGIESYLSLNIPAYKMVLGVPWYGYRYKCLKLVENKCSIEKKPFRGVPCSDAAGSQIDYRAIAILVKKNHIKINFDNSTMTPFFNYQDASNTTYQIWFDGPRSLKLKYSLADKYGLRGVGMWNADSLDYSDTISAQLQRKEMWGALPNYRNDFN
ncbi:di-N-acetylchitobiase [Patella vulgata]|uniref:di-N-acetylchitobiase n=1 Tax=Patella vulgata TaxID=6465 RepID=UPI00217F8B5C|nr:di-N-acetylchitobiase [Patella vulgata]